MIKYIPDDMYVNISNKPAVERILHSTEDTSLKLPGLKTYEEAINEILVLGETKISKYLWK